MIRTLALLLLLPVAAIAHPGHGPAAGLAEGALHPLGGADHLLAMTAVGLWAALTGGRALWAYPAAFLGAMVAGGALGLAGVAPPALEPAILASVIVLGALTALAVRAPLGLVCAALGLFGGAHGVAHGLEAGSGGVAYLAGFAGVTAALHGAGLSVGRGLGTLCGAASVRGLGALAALGGAALALG